MGEHISIDENTSSLTRLRYARARIKTLCFESLNKIVKLQMNGLIRDLRIYEEMEGLGKRLEEIGRAHV